MVQDRQLASLTDIQARIYQVRGVQVMLDRDLAVFYKVETAQLNRQVKRNIGRFPEDFMFQLTKEEWEALKCQIGISNIRGGDRRALPYAFTEQGVSQLSGVFHNELAEKISVRIIRAFVVGTVVSWYGLSLSPNLKLYVFFHFYESNPLCLLVAGF